MSALKKRLRETSPHRKCPIQRRRARGEGEKHHVQQSPRELHRTQERCDMKQRLVRWRRWGDVA